MSDKTVYVNTGVSWTGLLGVVFVLLKVFGVQPVASWSWVWVLCPFWIGLAIVLAVVVFGALVAGAAFGVAAIIDWWTARKRRKARGIK
jgi:hypothetical protein